MNDNAKKWVRALRSGEFQQAQNALHVNEGFCCLGVACELYRRENGGEWMEDSYPVFLGESRVLPTSVRRWLGLNRNNGAAVTNGVETLHLAAMNDKGKTFAEIADAIESEPAGLFVPEAQS